jgi:hypothetical protein
MLYLASRTSSGALNIKLAGRAHRTRLYQTNKPLCSHPADPSITQKNALKYFNSSKVIWMKKKKKKKKKKTIITLGYVVFTSKCECKVCKKSMFITDGAMEHVCMC